MCCIGGTLSNASKDHEENSTHFLNGLLPNRNHLCYLRLGGGHEWTILQSSIHNHSSKVAHDLDGKISKSNWSLAVTKMKCNIHQNSARPTEAFLQNPNKFSNCSA